jgi:serine/threonine protein kinase
MTELIWEQVEGDYPERNLRLDKLLSSDRAHAIFLGGYLSSPDNEREALIRLFLEEENYQGQRVNRLLEATFFEHPHIVRSFEAGTLAHGEFTFSYVVTERGDRPAYQSLDHDETLQFATQIMSALRYLHSKNLVYCVLSPETVLQTGGAWKLGDFSELRVTGNEDGYGTFSLAARVNTAPPEAAEGIISCAWDIWSLGQTLRSLTKKSGEPHMDHRNMDTNDGHSSPDPIRSFILACLNAQPSSRPSLDQLASILQPAEPAETRAASPSSLKARGSGA